ncbi:MAG: NAD(P)-dependent oxidoreductase [Planctomycetota bacterium]
MPKINLLVNLPEGFFTALALTPAFARLERIAVLRKTSHNTAAEVESDLAWADAVLMWSWPMLTHELLDKAPRLKFSAQLDVGQRAARIALDRGFPVSVARRGFSPAVAEMALGLILSTLRKISCYHAAMRAGTESWIRRFPADIDPDERQLTGRPVGLVGFGGVGRRLAELLTPFRCELRVHDPFVPDEIAGQFGAAKVPVLELVKSSDVVVLCASSNQGTAKLLGAAEIAALRRGAVLVNVARAALVDTAALSARLQQGDLYAAIDVFDKEPLPAESPLRTLPNAFLTPHRAGGIFASVERILAQLADDLEAHLAGRPRQHALTEAMLPSLDA